MGKYASKDTTPGSMIWPGAGIAVSTGSAWGTSITPSTGYLYYNGSTYSWDTKATMFTSPVFTGTGKMNGSFEIQESGVKKWTIVSESGTFTFKNASDVTKGILDQNGNFYVQGEVAAFATGSPTNWWDSMPVPTTTTRGGILLYDTADTTHYLRGDGTWQTVTGGTTVHSSLTNLDYASSGHTGFQAALTGTGFVKSTAGTISYDTNTYCVNNDARLSDSRPASDVYAWAKAATKPSYTASEVGLGNVTNESKATMFSSPTFTGTVTIGTNGILCVGNSNEIWYDGNQASDVGTLYINYRGYLAGQSYYRDTAICNGKGGTIMYIDGSTGNVGIGTASPSYKLDVSVGTSGIGIRQNYAANSWTEIGVHTGTDLRVQGQFQAIATGGDRVIIGARSNHPLVLNVNDTEKVRITSDGNVGIGTTSSNNKLQIGSGANQQYGILVESYYTSGYAQYVGNWPSSGRWGIGYNSGSADLTVKIGRVSDTIGSWTTGDFYLLVAGNVSATGEVTAYYSSDRYLKHNIRQFSALDKIDRMNPVAFQWNAKAKELNNSKDDRVNYGFIAQEVEAVMPELVHSIYGEYKSLDYTQIIPILTQAIKELREEVKSLKLSRHGS